MADVYRNDLSKIIKMFSQKMPYTKVGILRANNPREGGGKTNAEIGAVHEFGTTKAGRKGNVTIPKRSFLLMPILMFKKRIMSKVKKQKKINLLEVIELLGAAALEVSQRAFTNNGYGKWEPTGKWAKEILMGKTEKTAGNILVDTQQLRDSLNYEVVE